jgi:hypothetical protein
MGDIFSVHSTGYCRPSPTHVLHTFYTLHNMVSLVFGGKLRFERRTNLRNYETLSKCASSGDYGIW